jgi:hypothetical protein
MGRPADARRISYANVGFAGLNKAAERRHHQTMNLFGAGVARERARIQAVQPRQKEQEHC